MFDENLKQQLSALFEGIQSKIHLVYDECSHSKQQELLSMLEAISSTSTSIHLSPSRKTSDIPQFSIYRDGNPTGISFLGIPGGHEFSSLVLAILNAGGKGKLPDQGIQERIKNLPSGICLKTYISLTCENCPDVVQALNQIALIHGNLTHKMIDGAYFESELKAQNIQGVPSVISEKTLIHSGRATLSELLKKLELEYAASLSTSNVEKSLGVFDVTILGGGPAGAAAAIYSARKGLKTALIAERLGGQLKDTQGIENMISMVYTEGNQMSANLDAHLRAYPIEIFEHRKASKITENHEKNFEINLDSKEQLISSQLIIATGAKWRELNIPGEKEYLGRGVAFCPHCDGPYYKGKSVAVVGGGNSGVEAAIDLAGICANVTLIEYQEHLKADEVLVNKLSSLANVQVITNARMTEIMGDGSKVVGISYEDRRSKNLLKHDLDGVFVQIGLSPNSSLFKDMLAINQYGEIIIDEKGRTSKQGIYAAGDVTTAPYKQIVIALGEGAKAALTAFEDRMRSSPIAS